MVFTLMKNIGKTHVKKVRKNLGGAKKMQTILKQVKHILLTSQGNL